MAKTRFNFDTVPRDEHGRRVSVDSHLAYIREGLERLDGSANVIYYDTKPGIWNSRLVKVDANNRLLHWKNARSESVTRIPEDATSIETFRHVETGDIVMAFIKENQVLPIEHDELLTKEPEGMDAMVLTVLRKLLDAGQEVRIDMKVYPWFGAGVLDEEHIDNEIVTNFRFMMPNSLNSKGISLRINHHKPQGLPNYTELRLYRSVLEQLVLEPRGDAWVLTFAQQP